MSELLLEQDKQPQFSGHETFPLRQLWLRKAYDAVAETQAPAQRSVFAGEDAIVRFGVGKNMAMAIRFWATACGVVDETKSGYVPTDLGHYLFSPDRGRDPYCERPATTWLMHWQVASTPEKTTMRISAIVDACFSVIVDGVSARSRTRRGCAQAMV